jgi:chemotaxis methyl-accepting protein methylase
MSDALARVAELVHDETGIVTPDSQRPALAAALGRVAPGLDAERFLRALDAAADGDALVARLVDEVTIKETYFLREPRELRSIDWPQAVRAAHAGGRDAVRVWVAACATGEEAYSMAMLASEALGTAQPPVTILATDVSGAALARAAAATYTERSLRSVPPELRERHLIDDGGRHVVAPAARALVRFQRHNLLQDPFPPAGETPFDVIACRNVLIYFDGETVERVIGRLEAALRPAGRLILGAADRLSGTARRLDRATRARSAAPRRRRSPTPGPRRRAADRVEDALRAAGGGDLAGALDTVTRVLATDPLNADASFVRGLAELGLGDADAAVTSFRRALYVDPAFGLAAFQLGRAHDARGDERAARRAYGQALRTLGADDRHRAVADGVDLAGVAEACRLRLAAGTTKGAP